MRTTLRTAIRRVLLTSYWAGVAGAATATAADLPVPCVAGSCGSNGPATWVTSGAANAVLQGNSLTINQTSQNAILNWRSFNISPDGSVEFKQPDSTAVALNRIFQADPSRIFGSLKANGRIYLVNQNGIIFGEGARVNVAALVASTLDVNPQVMEKGLVAGAQDTAAFRAFTDDAGQPLTSAPLQVQQGAQLFADGGQVFLFAPVVENKGRIETPDGQTILAAGQAVYLSQSAPGSDLRGIVVAVDLGGSVENGDRASNAAITDPSKLVGQIIAERGNVTLAGLAVNQTGRVTATTSVRANGSVRLVAAQRGNDGGGNLTLGTNSVTDVQLDLDDEATTVDVNEQRRSSVLLAGNRVTLERNAAVVAPGGNIRIKASQEGAEAVERDPLDFGGSSASRIFIDREAVLDVSGTSVTLPMERNLLTVELRGSQLANSPDQRNGALRGERVQVDIRRSGTRADGSTWYGSPLADLSGDVSTIARSVAERNLNGGTVDLASQGDIVVTGGARVDVSGGQVRYQDGYLTPSALLGADGRVYDIGDADPLREYVGVLDGSSYAVQHPRWGITEHFSGTFAGGRGRFEQGYVEGKDAGSLSLLAPRIVFDGQLVASRTIGPHQRQPSAATLASGLYRPFDQLPLGGELLVGRATGADSRFVVGDVSIAPGLVLPDLRNDGGTAFDPLTDALPTSIDTVRVRPELFGEGAATRVAIRSDRSIEVPAVTELTLPAFSSVSLIGRNIDFAGSIDSAGGSVTLQARRTTTQLAADGELRLRAGARLDLAGAWINESALLNTGRSTEPLAIAGGTVTVSGTDSDVVLEAGSVIDVSGGAALRRNGSVTAGRGGTISLTAGSSQAFADQSSQLSIGSELRGYGLSQGGTLSLSAGEVCIGAQLSACGERFGDDALLLSPERFNTGGFALYAVTANRRNLALGADTTLQLQAQNLVLDAATFTAGSQRSLAGLTTVAMLDPALRRPASVSLRSDYLQATPLSADQFPTTSFLSLERGSSIVADPGARVALESDTSIRIEGSIRAPAGDISVLLNNDLTLADDTAGYAATQSIWLGEQSLLSTAGVARYQANPLGLLTGDVLAGGAVSLTAQRGFIAANPGSTIDVSGTSAPLDIRRVAASGTDSYERQAIASRGGAVNITAAEGLFLNSTLRAQSGDPEHVLGGALSVVLDATDRYGDFAGAPAQFPEVMRQLELARDTAPIAFGPGAGLAAENSGRAVLSEDAIERAGFDNLRIEARTRTHNTLAPLAGQILVGDGVDLGIRGVLTLDSASLLSGGGSAHLSAAVISMGQRSQTRQEVPATPASGSGSLLLDAQLIDVIGNSVLEGFADVTLRSSGDIRARGVQLDDARTLDGSLRTSGALTLAAQQVYPTTLSRFAFIADEADVGSITVSSTGPAGSAPLYSAAGQLTLRAPTITQGGVLRAPFGSISLNADALSLLAGSTTATSGNGLTIPFGSTQAGFDWVYQLGTQTLVYDEHTALPSQSLRLNAASVDIQSGATVDVRGGGDLVAQEFVPGVGGTRDVLSAEVRPDTFAIVPTSSLAFAPFDVSLYEDSSIAPGDSIHLEGGDGIAAGTYAILPARYALLPGAYYVRPVSGFQDLSPTQSAELSDGSTLVSGYRTFGSTGLRRDARNLGFSVRPGSEVLREAQYTSTSANAFFAARAADAGTTLTRLPRDSGTLSIAAGRELRLDGTLLGNPDTNGRGTALDISSQALRVVADANAPATQGVVTIQADALSRFGAESILLGGDRSQTADGLRITTRAQSVEIAAGTTVSAPELMLVASNEVSVAAGAELRGERPMGGARTTDLLLDGDGAMLRVTSGADAAITRTNGAGGAAVLRVEEGATLRASSGAIAAESAGTAMFAPTLDVAGGVLALTGDRISLGDAPAAASGLTLNAAQLAGLALDGLVLSSRSSIDFYGPVSLTAGDLHLRSGALRGFGSDTSQVTAGGTLTLEGAATATTEVAGTGSGGLILQADNLVLGAGSSSVSGFGSVRMQAAGAITLEGNGSLVSDADLALSGATLTASSGADRHFQVAGAFSYLSAGSAAPTLAAIDAPLGARVAVDAGSILFGGRAELHSGALSLFANSGDVQLADGADLRLSGVSTVFDSVPVASRGGSVRLESLAGNVSMASGAAIDVAAGSGTSIAERGSLAVSAVHGEASIAGSVVGGGADFLADAQRVADFTRLNARLNAGQFSGDRHVRQRGAGDLTVGGAVDEGILARSVELVADQGRIGVDGTIRSHAAGGGSIVLSARVGVSVAGTLDASAADATQRNGRIELRTTQGPVSIAQSAQIIGTSAAGSNPSFADGTLHIRAPRTLFGTLTDADAGNNALVLAGDLTRLNAITLEGYATYDSADGVISGDEIAATVGVPMFDDATSFASQSAAILTGLGTVRGPAPQVRAGIEITSAGNLDLQSEWSLQDWRFNSQPGYLTLRAAGDLTFTGSLSDGFTADNPLLLTETGESWSYRLAAGADLASADPLAVRPVATLAAGDGGTLRVGANGVATTIRTGTGSIELAAARNVELDSNLATIYTAGISTPGVSYPGRGTTIAELGGRMYPARGGDVRIQAGQDVLGATTDQLVTDWLWRVGAENVNPEQSLAPAWTVNFARFRQNVGALGGGDVTVQADGAVRDLSAVAPSIGRQVGGRTLPESVLEIIDGGNVDVRAGKSLTGGVFYSGIGSVSLFAGDAIGRSAASGLAPIVGLGDARAYLSSRTNLELGSVVNPTLLGRGSSQVRTESYFSTYTPDSSVALSSAGGDVRLVNDSIEQIRGQFSTVVLVTGGEQAISLYPADVMASALRGDLVVENSFALFPGSRGGLAAFAYHDAVFESDGGVQVIVSDGDPAYLPSLAAPQTTADRVEQVFFSARQAHGAAPTVFNATVPERLRLGRTDFEPSRIVALQGDVRMSGGLPGFYFAEPVHIRAGRDITGLAIAVQNLEERDVSSIVAGRDLIYPRRRDAFGSIQPELSEIAIDGPGTLQLRTGRNFDLQTSEGVSSRGNTKNAALAASGADISVQTGTAAQAPDYVAFIESYLASPSAQFLKDHAADVESYGKDLIAYMQARGLDGASFEASLTAFRQLSETDQAPLLERILFAELRASGRSAAQAGAGNNDFTRGFAALTTFYPKANPDLDAGETTPYAGDMNLYFSKLYTLDDGDIRLLAPGGEINAGLASPPRAFKLNKEASHLGIVAQRAGSVSALSFNDFLVNESRVFAADGGDILVWATRGDIDAGRGAKTAISAPPPTITFNPLTGAPIIEFPPALTGSGIQTLATSEGSKPGSVDLFAPRGVVNAGDAGIVAGNLTIAATAVLGQDNISASGTVVGVPVDTGGLGASLAGVSSVASSASNAAAMAVDSGAKEQQPATSLADVAMSWLDVFVVGLGEDQCDPKDTECLKRQSPRN